MRIDSIISNKLLRLNQLASTLNYCLFCFFGGKEPCHFKAAKTNFLNKEIKKSYVYFAFLCSSKSIWHSSIGITFVFLMNL